MKNLRFITNIIFIYFFYIFNIVSFDLYAQTESTFDSNEITYGWEIELKVDPKTKEDEFFNYPFLDETYYIDPSASEYQHYFPRMKNPELFPYLKNQGHVEASKNIEFQSLVSKNGLSHVIENMKDLRDKLKESKTSKTEAKSYHLHFRFPKSAFKSGDEVLAFKSYVSRIQDYILSYRTQYFFPYTALKTMTQTRNAPNKLVKKGTLRLITDDQIHKNEYKGKGNYYDLEIRGFMRDISPIGFVTQNIIDKIVNINSAMSFINFQNLIYSFDGYLPSSEFEVKYKTLMPLLLNKYLRPSVYNSSWAQEEYFMNNDSVILPLMGFEFSPYLNQSERELIKRENIVFLDNLLKLHSELSLDPEWNKYLEGKVQITERSAKHHPHLDKVRDLIKKWVQNTKFENILEKSLIINEIKDPQQLYTDPDFYRWLESKNVRFESDVLDIFKSIPKEDLAYVYFNENPSVKLPESTQQFIMETAINIGQSHLLDIIDLKKLHLVKDAEIDEDQDCQNSATYPEFSKILENLGQKKNWSSKTLKDFQEKLLSIGIENTPSLKSKLKNLNQLIDIHNEKNELQLKKIAKETIEFLETFF
jgi:hypothetical protein